MKKLARTALQREVSNAYPYPGFSAGYLTCAFLFSYLMKDTRKENINLELL